MVFPIGRRTWGRTLCAKCLRVVNRQQAIYYYYYYYIYYVAIPIGETMLSRNYLPV